MKLFLQTSCSWSVCLIRTKTSSHCRLSLKSRTFMCKIVYEFLFHSLYPKMLARLLNFSILLTFSTSNCSLITLISYKLIIHLSLSCDRPGNKNFWHPLFSNFLFFWISNSDPYTGIFTVNIVYDFSRPKFCFRYVSVVYRNVRFHVS
jgi:hypothetical protein